MGAHFEVFLDGPMGQCGNFGPSGQRSWSVGRMSISLIATCGGWLTR